MTSQSSDETAALRNAMAGEFLNLHELVAKARASLNQNNWDYIVGGTETETTMQRNRLALDSIALRPRVLRDVGKMVAVKLALAESPPDTVVMAAGDDRTDEDMFTALPETALTIHVGPGSSAAKLRVESQRTLLGLLARLV